MAFSKEFMFGVASSSYQTEGAVEEDGRTPSIWDEFCKTPGAVYNADNGDVACDHYHRYKEDVALMAELGVDSYRLSISWPRIFPKKGEYNSAGMAFYKKLLTELKDNSIKTAVTLYHWDIPAWAQERGGWTVRESIDWFLEYAQKCFEELDALTDLWITHNEPWCTSFLSYALGEQAPGRYNIAEAMKAAHHVLLSHGHAVRLYRVSKGRKPIGITVNLSAAYPATDRYDDALAASNADGFINRWFLDALFKGRYPYDIANLFASRSADFSFIQSGDFDIIGERCDFLGINYYNRSLIQYDPLSLLLNSPAYSTYKKTSMGWDVSPDEFIELIQMVRAKYTDLPIYITENGSAWVDKVEDGCVHDEDRIDYLIRHLQAVDAMNESGLNIAGYFYWSFMDNFEWAFGYSQRFGLVYCDFATQQRIKKDSFYAYARILRERKV